MADARMDARPGGSWRYVHRDADGATSTGSTASSMPWCRTERIVQTFEFEGVPGHVSLETATFEGQGGKTKVTSHSVFQSVEDRDGMVGAGWKAG